MKQFFVVCLLAAISQLAFGQAKSVEATLTQMERDLIQTGIDSGPAGIEKDVKILERIDADDYVGDYVGTGGVDGDIVTKARNIADIKSKAIVVQSASLSDMKVRVFGDTAVVTYVLTQKAKYKGQDISGKYPSMDVFVKRNGQWQIVANLNARLPN